MNKYKKEWNGVHHFFIIEMMIQQLMVCLKFYKQYSDNYFNPDCNLVIFMLDVVLYKNKRAAGISTVISLISIVIFIFITNNANKCIYIKFV